MKKLLITLSFLLLAFSAIAQEHLTFKSIPIDGSLSQFSAKLKADGFKEVATDNDGTWFIGKFTGKDCRILVQSSSVSKTVYAVYALFDNRSEWSMAKSDYNALKEALARKYGQPKSTEEFDKYYKNIKGLRLEAQEKLNKIKPLNIGQASRISGVSPADISVLLIWISGINRSSNGN